MADEEKLTDSNDNEESKRSNKKWILEISRKITLDIENAPVEAEKGSPEVIITQPLASRHPPLLIS